jgi:hypothetical protein
VNSGGVPPTNLALFVGTMMVLQAKLASGGLVHPAYVRPGLLPAPVVSVNVNLAMLLQTVNLVSSMTILEVPEPDAEVLEKEKSILYPDVLTMSQTIKLIKLDWRVYPPSAVAVKVIGYDPAVLVSRVADIQAVEVSFTAGQDG